MSKTGFEDEFEKIEDDYNLTFWFLVFSVVWSFKTCAKTAVNIKTEAKGFLPFFPTIILALRYLLIFLVRVGAIVTYFSPFIGLIGILDHYQVVISVVEFPREGFWQQINIPKENYVFCELM